MISVFHIKDVSKIDEQLFEGWPFCFEIILNRPDQEFLSYVISAGNEKERRGWMQAIIYARSLYLHKYAASDHCGLLKVRIIRAENVIRKSSSFHFL